MATLTIRNVPEDLHARLKERAKRNRRSVNQEVIMELARTSEADAGNRVLEARERMRRAGEKIDAMRAGISRFMTAEEIDAAIEEGRR